VCKTSSDHQRWLKEDNLISSFSSLRLDAHYRQPVPNGAWWARHDVALSPLTALHELSRVSIRKVELAVSDIARGARVVGTTVAVR